MAFDGEQFVADLRDELIESGRTLDKAVWVERVVQGEAKPEELVGWARQHYWGVTYHTRRVLSAWVTKIPYEMTDSVIENIAEEVLGTQSKTGPQPHPLAVRVHTRARRARRGDHACGAERRGRGVRELPLQHRPATPVVRAAVRRHPRHREPDPAPPTSASSQGFKEHYTDILDPDDYAFHTIHITVDEEHGGHVGEFAERYLDTEEKRRSARGAYIAGAELTRRCWDAFEGVTW